MQTSKQELLREANATGFRPEMIEKVWHLMSILDDISVHPFLRDRLVLKGGTALNLFFFELPRLSVDIDLNYVGEVDRKKMLVDRPEVEKFLELIFQKEGLHIRRIPEKHAGGKWQLRYASVLGGNGNLEVDLNYMFRMPLYGIHKRSSRWIGSRQTREIPLLDLHELGAGKLSALFARHASRDLFDAHQLLTKCDLNMEQLRLACIVYGAMSTKDWRQISVDDIDFDEKELKDQLIPVLRKHIFREKDWFNWTNKLLLDCKERLANFFPLKESERTFLHELLEHGIVDATSLTNEQKMLDAIHTHPLLQWRGKLVLANKEKNTLM